MIKHHQSNKELIPIFTTSSKRFSVLKQVVHDLANQMPDLKFSVFIDEKCCGVAQSNTFSKLIAKLFMNS